MESKKPSLSYSAMTYGLYLGLALVVYSLILYMASQNFNQGLNSLSYLIIAGGLFFSLKHYRNKVNSGVLSYGSGLKLGVLVALFAGFISGVFSYILFSIDSTLIDQMIQVQQQAMLESGMKEDQVAQMEEMMRNMSNPMILVLSSIFSMAFIGLIFSLVIAAIVKKNPTDPFSEAVKEVE